MCDNFSYSNNNDECRKFDWTSDEISELKKTEIFLAADGMYNGFRYFFNLIIFLCCKS